jgi:protein phosphatase
VDESRWGTLIAVADGVGGCPGGDRASRDAVHHLQALYYAQTGPAAIPDRLRDCTHAVNALARHRQRQEDLQDGRLTTLVAAAIHLDRVWIANVGDSRAYLVAQDGRVRQLNQEDRDRDDPESTGITKAVGQTDHLSVDLYAYRWERGDRLVLATDGLHCLSTKEIARLVSKEKPLAAAHALVRHALHVDGSDNSTAVVVAWDRTRRQARLLRGTPLELALTITSALLLGILLGGWGLGLL